MRAIVMRLVVISLFVGTTATASPGPDKDKPANGGLNSTATTRSAADSANPMAAAAASPALEAELEQLKELLQTQAEQLEAQRAALQEQQKRITTMEEELKVSRAARAAATSSADALAPSISFPEPASVVTSAIPQDEKKMQEAAMKKDWEDRIKQIGPFSFSGDLRLRDEPFFDGPKDQSQVRNRERFRLRFNAIVKYEDVGGGLSLASGDINDPISTNQTANQEFTRKPFLLDKAFITYNPHYLKTLTLTGGKFAYPFYRTELTWDNDLNPEGVAETLDFKMESVPVLKRITLVGFQLPFAETAGINFNFLPVPAGSTGTAPPPIKSIHQSAVYGGQVGTSWQLASWLKFGAYAAFYNFHNADPVALAVATVNAASPANALLKLGGSSVQNSFTTITLNTPVPTTTPGVNTDVNSTVINAQFASKFSLLDSIGRFDVKTPSDRWPIIVLGDYVQNTKACSNQGNIFVPTPAVGSTITTKTNASCTPNQRRAYWLEARLGRTTIFPGQTVEKGDWDFAYTRMFIEREAVLTTFNFSDLRQGSNVSQHRVEVSYQAYKNVTLAFTGLIGRPLNFGSSKPPEDWLKRLQFDVIYKF